MKRFGFHSIQSRIVGLCLWAFLCLVEIPPVGYCAEIKANEKMDQKYTNRLIREKSPYLLQHAHNPVDWYAWGEEAFAKARAEKKLMFLSIGYSTCHWCHVMERESFENPRISEILNRDYGSRNVDREERP